MTDDKNSQEHRLGGASGRPWHVALKNQVEALLFAAHEPLEIADIRNVVETASALDLRMVLRELQQDYDGRAFFLHESGGRYQLRTRPEHAALLQNLFRQAPRSLSRSALETLAIIAYKQPVTRSEINAIRGVDSSSIVANLKERELIHVTGTRKEIGNPLEFRTTTKFLEIFGLSALSDLPRLRSLEMNPDQEREIVSALSDLESSPEATPGANALAFSEEQ